MKIIKKILYVSFEIEDNCPDCNIPASFFLRRYRPESLPEHVKFYCFRCKHVWTRQVSQLLHELKTQHTKPEECLVFKYIQRYPLP